MRFKCEECDHEHEGLPDIAFRLPTRLAELKPPGDVLRAAFSVDLCKHDELHFVRGIMSIPILGTGTFFNWGVWVEVIPDTLDLAADVHLRGSVRPSVELAPSDHALAVHQHEGIELGALLEIIGPHLHPRSC